MKKIIPLLSIILMIAAIAIVFVSMAKKEAPVTIAKGNVAFKLQAAADQAGQNQRYPVCHADQVQPQRLRSDRARWADVVFR